jgi:glucose-1-phosphate cytidylyltransferase
MKVVILAGGLGTRLTEETIVRPKPMVEIGGMPILWHIMKIYSTFGFNDFIICLGYKGYIIKEFFSNYLLHRSDVTIDLKNDSITVHNNKAESWNITLVETGHDTMTGGRLKRVESYINNETFMFTYGDGVSNVNIDELLAFHKTHKKYCTVTAVQPAGRFGVLDMDEDQKVLSFMEKPRGEGSWINAGFMVCEPSIFKYIKGDETIWEREPMEMISNDGQLFAYKHQGYWKPMDTLRDKNELEEDWRSGTAEWKIWK